MIGEADDTGEAQQTNHRQLYDFLTELLAKNREIEIYGCWDGDFAEPAGGEDTLRLSRFWIRPFIFENDTIIM